jgi:hypothetical protein
LSSPSLVRAYRHCAFATNALAINAPEMVSTTVLSSLNMTDLEAFHKSPRAGGEGFFMTAYFLRLFTSAIFQKFPIYSVEFRS